MLTEYRVTGRGGDGGTLEREGTDREAICDELRADGYEIVKVESRQITEWASEWASAPC